MTFDGSKPPEFRDFCRDGTAGGNGPGQPADRPWARASRNSDRTSLSGRAQEIGDLIDAVRALPDVRLDKVAAIRKAIESGTYVVNAEKVARKMIDEIR